MAKKLLFTSIIFSVFIFLAGSQLGFTGDRETGRAASPGLVTSDQAPTAGQELFNGGHLESRQVKPSLEIEPTSTGNEEQVWIDYEQDNVWEPSEIQMVQQAVEHTIRALEKAGLNGQHLLTGYRFGHYQGEYVDGAPGRLAIVDHQQKVITLSDAAFKRHHGFNIYHELGHVVDFRLGRQMSQLFHDAAGSQQTEDWLTADGYWLRQHGRDDREEATADAFALWVMTGQASFSRPVFYGTPVTTDYDGLNQAIDEALLALDA